MFWNFFPAEIGTASTVLFSLWIVTAALGVGGLLGSGNKPNWQRLQRRWQAEAQAATADPAGRFCCSCRWARWHDRQYVSAEWKCAHPKAMRSAGQYHASGDHALDNMHACSLIRELSGEAVCGAEGRFWEKRTSPDF